MLEVRALPLAELRARTSEKWREYPADVLPLFVAETDFPLAPTISSALRRAVDRGDTGYVASRTPLASTYSDFALRRFGWQPDPARMRSTADVSMGIVEILRRVTRPGERVVVTPPVYPPFYDLVSEAGAEVERVPLRHTGSSWELDLDGIRAAFESGATAMLLCNPHNPLGTVATRDELLAIAETVSAARGRVFADEIHAPIVYAPAQHIPYASVSDAAAAHTFTATSASKAWNLAGLKCAQVIISNDADAELWERLGFWPGHGTSTLGVVANIAAYTAGAPWLDDVVEYLDGNRRMLAQLVDEKLPGVRMIVPEGSYIALLDFRETGLTGDLAEWFREHAGVAMTDGAACGEAAIGYTRFVFALPRPLLVEAVERIAAALAGRESVSA